MYDTVYGLYTKDVGRNYVGGECITLEEALRKQVELCLSLIHIQMCIRDRNNIRITKLPDTKKNKEMKQRLLEIKAKRQDAALENMSDEDLDKMIAGLGE